MISICISTSYMTRLISLSHHQHRATQTCYPTESTSHKKQHLCPPHVLEPRICITEPGWKWRSVRPIPPRSLSYQWSGRVENGRIYFGFWSFFEVTQIEHLCPNWTGLQSLRFALSSLGKTWLETFIFSFYFVGFELPCFFYIYFFPSYNLTMRADDIHHGQMVEGLPLTVQMSHAREELNFIWNTISAYGFAWLMTLSLSRWSTRKRQWFMQCQV